jgi:hypothetical protein
VSSIETTTVVETVQPKPSDHAAVFVHATQGTQAITGPSSSSRAASSALLARNIAASSGDVLKGVDALLSSSSPLATELKSALSSMVMPGGSDARLARDAQKTAALLTVLADFVKDGALDLDAVATSAGPAGSALVAALVATAQRAPPSRVNFMFLARVVDALGPSGKGAVVVDRFLRDDSILPREVPGLREVKDLVRADRFHDEGVVAVQHLLPTSLAFFEALVEKGMDPSRIHVLGTPYASNPLVVSVLRLQGIDATRGTDPTTSTVWFEKHRTGEILDWLESKSGELRRMRPPGGYQILDDGGLLQLAAASDRPHLASIFPPGTRAVEQTTRGITELSKRGPQFVTVAVAKSAAKAREGDVIGFALGEALIRELAQRGMSMAKGTPAVVVSAGVVGMKTAETLRDAGFAVTVVDMDEKKRAAAQVAGFSTASVVDAALAKQSQVILSCTGKTAMSGDALVEFEGLLASGSSMAIEFNVEQVNAFRASPIHDANRGRPLNFEGDGHENLTPAQIGIPRALNFAALAQEVTDTTPRFVDVDAAFQKVTVEAWEKAGGANVAKLDPAKLTGKNDKSERPDAMSSAGTARHDEWMAFLMGLGRPVCPRPSTHMFMPGVYFFEDKDGSTRMIDTRGDGKSVHVQLPSTPRTATHTSSAPGTPLLLECPGDDGRVSLVEVDAATGRARAVGEADKLARIYVADHRSLTTGQGPVNLGFTFVDDREIVVRAPEASSWKRLPLPAGVDAKNALVVWPHKDALLVVDKKSAQIHLVKLSPSSFFADMMGMHARDFPAGLVSVDAVAAWDAQKTSILVGRDAEGRVALGQLTPQASKQLTTLPKDAVFRGVRPEPDEKTGLPVVGRFRVDYTLPGDPVEVEHYRLVVIDEMGALLQGLRAP